MSCPDNTFLNSVTGQCETFTTGAPPPALPSTVPWGFWQWAILVGALSGAGMLAFEGYKHHRSQKASPKLKMLGAAKLSKFQAERMGSEHFLLLQNAASEPRESLARDFRSRANSMKAALKMNGWQILPDGIHVERIK
jgi:hypothetical protein